MVLLRAFLSLIFLVISLRCVRGQDVSTIPQLLPSYSEDFSTYSTSPSTCIQDVFLDKNGKMWLTACGAARLTNNLHLFQFDGYSFKLVQGALSQLTNHAKISGMLNESQLVGFQNYPDSSRLFSLDLESDQLQFQSVRTGEIIQEMTVTEDNRIFLMMVKDNRWTFYEWINDRLELQSQIEAPIQRPERGVNFYADVLYHDEDECWLNVLNLPYILCVNKKTATTRKFYPVDFDGDNSNNLRIIRVVQADAIYVSRLLNESGNLFRLDSANNRFVSVKGVPQEWNSDKIFKDQLGNLIFLFKDNEGKYQAILQDIRGKRYNYSAFFESLSGTNILQARSPDFRQQIVICSDKGILLHTVKASESIQHFLTPYQIRAMVELPGGQFLVSTQANGSYLLDQSSGTTTKYVNPDCDFGPEETLRKIIRDEEGYLWSHFKDNLIKFNPVTKTCESYLCESSYIHLFTFIDDDRVAVVDNRFNLVIYHLRTQTTEPFLKEGQPMQFSGFVHDIYFSQEGWLWIATSAGLWKVHPETGEMVTLGYEAPFPDSRFLCIHEDEKGRLWLGTALNGLNIYDPRTGEMQILNNEQGLANNTVVSVLPDEEGIRWVGTYNGISMVTSEGQLITNIYPQDGLADRESNRFAYLRASDGQLLMGTVRGLNIINPQKIKERLHPLGELNIYLTALEYPEKTTEKTQLLQYGLNTIQQVHLPAVSRFLKLSFALSNYFKPEQNQYAYMLEGLDEDWTFLGNQHTLNLNNLPAGDYRLLVKGSDGIGNWTAAPLTISIHAQAFFYQQVWFYLLCLAFLGGIAVLWIQRLRMEVKRATYKIQHDKEVIEQQAGQLRELDKVKSRFFTNISHELRTPLTIIGGMASQIEKAPQQWLRQGIRMIKRNNAQLLNLVNQILDLRKLESGTLKLALIQGDIIFYLRYIVESFHSLAEDKSIKLHFLNQEKTLMMDFDKEKILRVVSNLLSNAIKFTPQGGDVYLLVDSELLEKDHTKTIDNASQTDPTSSVLTLKVKDTGIGIPAEKMPYIFDRFYQVDDSSTRKGEGTGIGLALTKELLHLMGGEIKVESKAGKGTTFHVTLPITRNAPLEKPETSETDANITSVEEEEMDEANLEEILPAASTQPTATLLIIEDNMDVVSYLKILLSDHYQLHIAHDGQQGIEKALEYIPDLIISDVMMPKKDGFEVCDTLKQDARTSHIPIVLLTAKADVDSRIAGLQRGADAYLAKPFNQQELFIRLEKLHQLRQQLQARYRSLEGLPVHIGPTDLSDTHPEDAFINKLKGIVEEHLHDADFGIPELCREVGMSRSQLHLKIKALTNRSTSHFIRSIRLYKAKELLRHSDLTVTEVGFEVGFQDPAYFSRTFTKEFGVSPFHFQKTDV